MKVVQIVTQMEAAGAQEVAYYLREGLSRKGHDSELWFLYKNVLLMLVCRVSVQSWSIPIRAGIPCHHSAAISQIAAASLR